MSKLDKKKEIVIHYKKVQNQLIPLVSWLFIAVSADYAEGKALSNLA